MEKGISDIRQHRSSVDQSNDNLNTPRHQFNSIFEDLRLLLETFLFVLQRIDASQHWLFYLYATFISGYILDSDFIITRTIQNIESNFLRSDFRHWLFAGPISNPNQFKQRTSHTVSFTLFPLAFNFYCSYHAFRISLNFLLLCQVEWSDYGVCVLQCLHDSGRK